MNKQKQIENKLAEPITVGLSVDVRIEYTELVKGKGKKAVDVLEPRCKTGYGTVVDVKDHDKYGRIYKIKGDNISIPSKLALEGMDHYSGGDWYLAEWVFQRTDDCGANPFKPSPRINFFNQTIMSVLSRGGFGRRSDNYEKPEYSVCNNPGTDKEDLIGCTYGGTNFDPFVIDKDGNKQYYQRGLVWTLEQKQLLIESIYNGIEIGKFLFRYRSWENMEEQMRESGHGYSYDCVDGKQRFNAILEFVQDKFPDFHGNYYSDLSERAQWNFMDYGKLTVGEMSDSTKDNEVIAGFLHLNYTGVPMSKEHIEHVQSIKL